jgi:hypothetical protein
MSDTDRLRIALQLTRHLSVRRIAPDDDDYTGTDGHYEFRVEGIAEAAEALAKERDLLLRMIESAERHLRVATTTPDPGTPRMVSRVHVNMGLDVLTAAVRLLRDGQVPARMREGAGT